MFRSSPLPAVSPISSDSRICVSWWLGVSPQTNKSKERRRPSVETKDAHSNATIKQEPQQETTNSYVSIGWQESASVRQRQGVLQGNLNEAAKTPTGAGLESKGTRARGGRGHARGGGKVKPASPVSFEAASRSEEGERPREEASTPVAQVSTPVAQACAERKEAQSPDLSSSFRKSPRSKEVRVRNSSWSVMQRARRDLSPRHMRRALLWWVKCRFLLNLAARVCVSHSVRGLHCCHVCRARWKRTVYSAVQ